MMAQKPGPRHPNKFWQIFRILFQTFGPQHWWPAESAFEVMVGAILTQNTNWVNVDRALRNLKQTGLLRPRALLANRRKLPALIRPAGYYNLKTQRLVNFLEYFIRKYRGDKRNYRGVPTRRLRDELLDIPGIGPETGDSILLYALGRPVFVVDSYTRRIFIRHRFFPARLSYEGIRHCFESNLPRRPRIYNEYHALIVRLGKEYCKKNEPLCAACPIRDIYH
jgi:endonuclease-3 related protein